MSQLIRKDRTPVWYFTLAYILLFSAGFIYGGNYEFAIYTVVMLAALFIVSYIIRDVDMPNGFLWALSVLGIVHMAGGGVHVHGDRLYGYQVLHIFAGSDPGLVILKYDQVVHLFGYAVIAIAIHCLLRRTAPGMDAVGRAVVSVFAAMAIGSLNELAEFVAVLALPRTGVGDYFNTMLDLSFNTLGAAIGVAAYEAWLQLKKMRQ